MIRCSRCDTIGTAQPGQHLPDGWVEIASSKHKSAFPVCDSCAKDTPAASRGTGDAAADRLRLFIERIERLEAERAGISDDIRDVYSEARATGYDTKGMKEIVKLRKLSPHDRQEREAILETYKASLGMD